MNTITPEGPFAQRLPEPTEHDREVAERWAKKNIRVDERERRWIVNAFAAGRASICSHESTEKNHGHDGPCALRILGEFYSLEDAYGIALEHTCFPMDCETASRQAIQLIAEAFCKKPDPSVSPNDDVERVK